MPHVLSLTNLISTINLTTTNWQLVDYVPRTPTILSDGTIPTVTEPIELLVYGANTDAVRTQIRAVERMFVQAQQRQRSGVGPKVYLQLQTMGEGSTNRSEVVSGRLDLDKDSLTAFAQAKTRVTLFVTRRGFWEGPRAAISFTNQNGTATSGLAFYNHSDGTLGHNNYVDIAGSSIAGSLPAPLELRFINTTGGARNFSNFRIANNTFDTSLSHIIEGEAATSGGSNASNANSSGNLDRTATGANLTFFWDIPAATLQKLAGRFTRVLARVTNLTSLSNTAYAQLTVFDYYGILPLWQGPEVLLQGGTDAHQDFGVVPLPPAGYDVNGSKLQLRLTVRQSGSFAFSVDFLQLTPADDLCYRHLLQRGMQVLNNGVVVDDGIEGLAYYIESGANNHVFNARTQPVHVFPGVDQRLYFLIDGQNMTANWLFAVAGLYRPRRLSL